MNFSTDPLSLYANPFVLYKVLGYIVKNYSTEIGKSSLLEAVSISMRSDALESINELVENNVIKDTEYSYKILWSKDDLLLLCGVQYGIYTSKSNTLDSATPVLTLPSQNSLFEESLRKKGPKVVNIYDTKELLSYLFSKAEKKVEILTPFLDKYGANFISELLLSMPNKVDITFIVRFLSFDPAHRLYPVGIHDIIDKLSNRNIEVYDYAIPRENESLHETFHAKVVNIDDELIYIGSSNFNKFSLDNSLELGVLISGKPISLIKAVISSIKDVSTKFDAKN